MATVIIIRIHIINLLSVTYYHVITLLLWALEYVSANLDHNIAINWPYIVGFWIQALTQICHSSLTSQWLIALLCLLRSGIWYDQSSALSLHRGTMTSNLIHLNLAIFPSKFVKVSQMLRWRVFQGFAPTWHGRWLSLFHIPWRIWLWIQTHNYIRHFILLFWTITLVAAATADATTDIFLRHATELFPLLNKYNSSLAIGFHR